MRNTRVLAPVGSVERLAVRFGAERSRNVAMLAGSGVAQICDGFATAHALFAFVESPLFGDLERHGAVSIDRAVQEHGCSAHHTRGLMRYLVTQDIFREQADEVFYLAPAGFALFSPAALGYLRWFMGGYREVIAHSASLLRQECEYGRHVVRDPFYTADGSSQLTSAVYDEVPYSVFEQSGHTRVCDLGCGSGKFLIEFARRNPNVSGIGIDFSASAIDAATAAAKLAGVDGRLEFLVGDCQDLTRITSLCDGRIDAFYSFALEHEFLRDGEMAVISRIDRMADAFPDAIYLVGEPCMEMIQADGSFYWIHMLTMQGLPRSIAGWTAMLQKLERARLRRILQPDHQVRAAYFEVELGGGRPPSGT